MAVKRIRKADPEKEVLEDSGKKIQKLFHIDMTVGDTDRECLWSDRVKEIVDCLAENFPDFRITPMGGYYLVGGRVCLPDDYDPERKDFRPGTHPPSWAMTKPEQDELAILQRIEREKKLPAMARNSPYVRTAAETDRIQQLRKANGEKAAVEWSEDDVDSEELVTAATAEALNEPLASLGAKKLRRVLPPPKKLRRKA